MNELIINELIEELGIEKNRIEATLKLLSEGATIPFIARYRKDVTGSLDEESIKLIGAKYNYYEKLLERKDAVIRLIDEKGLLTDELRNCILKCTKLTEVEDLYRPYKEKKKTKATDAINNGLEALAKMIMAFPTKGSLDELAKKFINDKVKSVDEALEGAGYIIAEWISDNAQNRKYIRNYYFKNGVIVSKKKKNANDEHKTYDMYYDYSEPVKNIKHYRVLAINRGEDEGILSVSVDVDSEYIAQNILNKMIKNKDSFVVPLIESSVKDSLKRLILPSVEREVRSELTQNAEDKAIETFGVNLEHLLLTRPIKGMVVLGFDPGYINGCKLAIVDESGNYITSAVVKPFINNISNVELQKIKEALKDLVIKYNVDIISIGNGTASRESVELVSSLIKEYNLNVKYVVTSEAGASIYSASKIAIEEFPDLAVEKRSAVSIARRIQDPLSELVKIDPKSIGVGEYQYDVNQKSLTEALDFTTSKVVNKVGVSINTASKSILKYVSGLNKTTINNIYEYKEKNRIKSRDEIKKIKGVSDKVYEQAVGFLRIPDSVNPLDNTGIHPESYDLTNKILNYLSLDIKDINNDEFKNVLDNVNVLELVSKFESDEYTIGDIIKELKSPGLDPRDSLSSPKLKSDVLHIEDLKIGMELTGIVRNVASFGAFIDIGLHDDGLVHISKMSKSFVKNPTDIVNVGDIVTCYVDNVDLEKQKVQLSLIK